ncbi:MAG: F0F1 ATP synthase subunit delta [bacterium]
MPQKDHIHETLDEFHKTVFTNCDSLESELCTAWNKIHGVQMLRIVSAHELTGAEKKGFEECLPEAEISYAVDPKLISGVKVEWSDRVLDVSAKGMIEKMRETLFSAK